MVVVGRLSEALSAPFVDPASRTFLPALLVALLIAAVVQRSAPGGFWVRTFSPQSYRTSSSKLDLQLLAARQLLRFAGWLPGFAGAYWLATRLVMQADAWFGRPEVELPLWALVPAYSLTLFVCWDASRYALHRLMHAVPFLWELHQVHHSATALTPLTFHRLHPLESVLYQLRGVVVTGVVTAGFFWLARGAAVDATILGVNALGFVFNGVSGNLRHSHVWWRFPAPVERWLLSPAQHQLHHGLEHGQQRSNYGTWLAVWDRMLGSLALAPAEPVTVFGVDERNHEDHLLSAWFGPLAAWGRAVLVLLAALGLTSVAAAQEEGETVARDDRGMEVIVESDGDAGSSAVITEEELELFEYDDIGKLLPNVAGVYVRGEDGYGLRPNIGIRGANSERSAKITLMEDGVLLAPAPYAAPAAYYFPMTTRMVGVEVFKGPSAIQHGPHTIGGAVNLVTRAVPDHASAAVDVAYGRFDTSKLHGWASAGDDRLGVLIEGVNLASGGFKELDTGGPTGFGRGELMGKARWRSDPELTVGHQLELKLGYAAERSHETYMGLHVDDYEANPLRRYAATANGLMEWKRNQAELAWEVRTSPQLRIRTVAYTHQMSRAWTKVNRFASGPDLHTLLQSPAAGASEVYLAILRGEEDSVTSDQNLMIGTNDRQFLSYGVQSKARWLVRNKSVRSEMEVGLRVHADDVVRRHTENTFAMQSGELVDLELEEGVLLDAETKALAIATHVHEDFGVGALRIVPGMRLETIRTERIDVGIEPEAPVWRNVLLPGLGALLHPAPKLDLFVGAYRGFSPVAPGEPEDVKPESSWNLEAGTRAGDPLGLNAQLIGFLNLYENIVGACTFSGGCLGDAVDRQFNGGAVDIYGVEATAGHQLLLPARMSVPLDASYTYTESRFRTGFVSAFPQFGAVEAGDSLPYVPQHQGSVQASLAHPRGKLGLVTQARSGMLDSAGVYPVPEETGVPALVTLDLALHVNATERIGLYSTLTNLTNAQPVVSWRPFGARPPAPFQWSFGVKLRPKEHTLGAER